MKLACFGAGRIKGVRPRKVPVPSDGAVAAFVKQIDMSERTALATESAVSLTNPEAVLVQHNILPVAGTRVGYNAQRIVEALIVYGLTVLTVNAGTERRP